MRRVIPTILLAVASLLVPSGCDRGGQTEQADRSEQDAARDAGETPAAPHGAGTTPSASSGDRATPAPATARGTASPALAVGAQGRTASGVSYRVLTAGKGSSPPKGATVRIHCRGWTLGRDGSRREFLDTYNGGVPERFLLTDDLISGARRSVLPDAPRPLIPGLVDAISEMKPGEKREVRVPASLGYGEAGNPPLVPRNADLVFEVELVGFES